MKANTSPHLAEHLAGSRDFVAGTLYDVLTGAAKPPADRPVVFSPFGLGVLDLAVAKYVYDRVDVDEGCQRCRLLPRTPAIRLRPARIRSGGRLRRRPPDRDSRPWPRRSCAAR